MAGTGDGERCAGGAWFDQPALPGARTRAQPGRRRQRNADRPDELMTTPPEPTRSKNNLNPKSAPAFMRQWFRRPWRSCRHLRRFHRGHHTGTAAASSDRSARHGDGGTPRPTDCPPPPPGRQEPFEHVSPRRRLPGGGTARCAPFTPISWARPLHAAGRRVGARDGSRPDQAGQRKAPQPRDAGRDRQPLPRTRGTAFFRRRRRPGAIPPMGVSHGRPGSLQ